MSSIRPLILASNSPRRQELLRTAGYAFEVLVHEVSEDYPLDLPPNQVAEFLAKHKNEHYRKIISGDQVVITADTTVVSEGEVLNKPATAFEAKQMLEKLSNKTHLVISGVAISDSQRLISFSDSTEVSFLPLSENEIDFYIEHCKPFDKAGAYGIQEWIGLTRISAINGSYYNVMGLPVHQLYSVLMNTFNIYPSHNH